MIIQGTIKEIPFTLFDSKLDDRGEVEHITDPFGFSISYYLPENGEELSYSLRCNMLSCEECVYNKIDEKGKASCVAYSELFPELESLYPEYQV